MPTSESDVRVTFIVLAYKHEQFIREALQGAFSQTYAVMDILISDDASPDATWEIIEEVVAKYDGPHHITTRRNEKNMGINAHFNLLIPLIRGDIIVISAGDDVSLPNRTEDSVALLEQGYMGMHGNAFKIDENSVKYGLLRARGAHHLCSWQDMLTLGMSGVAGATMAWRKEVFEVFGAIPSEPLGEDAFIPFRCALMGGMGYSSEAIVQYRSHSGNVSFWKALEGGEKRNVGKMRYRHRDEVLKAWRLDIKVAYQKGYLSEEAYQKALLMSEQQSELLSDLASSMNMSIWQALHTFWKKHKVYSSLSHPLRLLIEGYLVYTHFNLYRLMHIRQGMKNLTSKVQQKIR